MKSAIVRASGVFAAGLTCWAATGCVVSKSKYDAAVKDATQTHEQLHLLGSRTAQRISADAQQMDDLKQRIEALAQKLQERDTKLSEAGMSAHNLQAKLDESTAINQQLRGELSRLGKNVDQLLSDKGTLSRALEDAKTRLEELRKAQTAAEARAALFKDLVARFKKMTDAGELKVVLREGRMVLQLPNDVLFDSGRPDLKPAGQAALRQVAAVLKTLANRKYQVAGHTDNVPIQRGRFASNWELSTARAVAVVRFMIEQGVKPDVLSAAGYGEFNPVAANDSVEGRAKNRRIEVVLLPNLDEVLAVPDVK